MKKKHSAQSYLAEIVRKIETLPKVRDALLEIVNDINMMLVDGEERVLKGPRKNNTVRRSSRPRAKFLKEMPKGARSIRGIDKSYLFVPGLGMVSKTNNGKVRLLVQGKQNKGWNVVNSKGERIHLGVPMLEKRLPGVALGL